MSLTSNVLKMQKACRPCKGRGDVHHWHAENWRYVRTMLAQCNFNFSFVVICTLFATQANQSHDVSKSQNSIQHWLSCQIAGNRIFREREGPSKWCASRFWQSDKASESASEILLWQGELASRKLPATKHRALSKPFRWVCASHISCEHVHSIHKALYGRLCITTVRV